MKIQNIIDFLFLRRNFVFETSLEVNDFENLFNQIIRKNKNFDGRIIKDKFNCNYLSNFLNWNPAAMPALIIKAEIIENKNNTIIKGKFYLNILMKSIFSLASAIIVILYLINFNGFADTFTNFPIHPLISPIIFYLFVMLIYLIESGNGKSDLALIIKTVEKNKTINHV